jgi:hypothetical protein
MTQALYAYMNNKTIKKKDKCVLIFSYVGFRTKNEPQKEGLPLQQSLESAGTKRRTLDDWSGTKRKYWKKNEINRGRQRQWTDWPGRRHFQ